MGRKSNRKEEKIGEENIWYPLNFEERESETGRETERQTGGLQVSILGHAMHPEAVETGVVLVAMVVHYTQLHVAEHTRVANLSHTHTLIQFHYVAITPSYSSKTGHLVRCLRTDHFVVLVVNESSSRAADLDSIPPCAGIFPG